MKNRVAMLVHNPVTGDARVRKEAFTLANHGYNVTLFGYGDVKESPSNLEGCKLVVVQKSPMVKTYTAGISFLRRSQGWLKKNKLLSLSLSLNLLYLLLEFELIMSFDVRILLLILPLVAFVTFEKLIPPTFKNFFLIKKAHYHIANKLADAVNIDDFDIIHAHDMIALISAMELKKKKPDLKIIWDAHELYSELNYKSDLVKGFMTKVIKYSSDQIDGFITISSSFAEYYGKKFPNLPVATILMNAARRSDLEKTNKNLLRNATSLSPDQKILLFQGGFSQGRGIDMLLECADKLPLNWTIVFMGDGPLKRAICKTAQKLKAHRPIDRPAVAVVPPAPYADLASWTSGADLGVIPYENTGPNHLYCTPNKLWEYPNALVPILATPLVEISAMIEKHGTGILLPKNYTAADLTTFLLKTTENELDRLKSNCHDFNKTESWNKYEPALIALYAGL